MASNVVHRASINVRESDSIAVKTLIDANNVTARIRTALEVLYLVEQRFNCDQTQALSLLMNEFMQQKPTLKANNEVDISNLLGSL